MKMRILCQKNADFDEHANFMPKKKADFDENANFMSKKGRFR